MTEMLIWFMVWTVMYVTGTIVILTKWFRIEPKHRYKFVCQEDECTFSASSPNDPVIVVQIADSHMKEIHERD